MLSFAERSDSYNILTTDGFGANAAMLYIEESDDLTEYSQKEAFNTCRRF